MRLRSARAIPRDLLRVGLTLALVVTARSSLADHYFVPSGSMLPTVEPRDHIVVDKLAYGLRVPLTGAYALHFAPPARGDVVVLSSPDDGTVLLKRVVGVPGDRVTITEGTVVIDGQTMPVYEQDGAWDGTSAPEARRGPHLIEALGASRHPINLGAGGGPDFGPVRIPPGRYLVLGDNRGDSRDGRYFGLVARDGILGRAEGIVVRHGTPTWVGLGR
jgi:signal peptidase I